MVDEQKRFDHMVDEQKWGRKWFRFCFSLAIAIQGTVRSCVELDLDLGVAEVVIHLLEISLTHFFSAYDKSKKKKELSLMMLLHPSITLFVCILLTWLVSSKLTVHLVPHTHDDVGWLKTVDQYTYGLNNTIYPASVNVIISSAIGGLLEDSTRRFTYVETGFFYRWWVQQREEMKQNVRMLAGQKRLQFANGGWCMHDEAAPHYIDMIDQTTLGHRFLQRELKVVPKVGWQIDPFGHSAFHAVMSAQAGFLGTYHARIDYQDLDWRSNTKQREFMWQASPSLPEQVLLGGVLLHGRYGPPDGFNWDITGIVEKLVTGRPMNIVDDMPWSDQNNVQNILERVYQEVNYDASATLDENVMWTMGSDFNYMAGQFWFVNMDKLIEIVNADGKVNMKYSTPYDYTIAKLLSNVTYPTKTDDFFPYADGPHSYWTGYFTSRAALKRYVRSSSQYWTVSRQVQALAGIYTGEIPSMADAMGILQHHDAVAGTAKQHVAFDYAKRLAEGYQADFTERLTKAFEIISGSTVAHCPRANESICDATNALLAMSNVTVLIWNPDGHSGKSLFVEIPIPTNAVEAVGSAVMSFTVFEASQPVNNYGPDANGHPFTISVEMALPAAGYNVITLVRTKSVSGNNRELSKLASVEERDDGGIVVSTSAIQLTFSGTSGMLSTITCLATGLTISVVQDWCTIESSIGDLQDFQAGGAYIFRPANNNCTPLAENNKTLFTKVIATGQDFAVVEQQFAYVTQRIILKKDVFDIEFTVNGISIADGWGKELVLRLQTSLQNGQTFYTDSNGREMQQRVINQRKYYPFTQTEPVAGNYYPVNTLVFMSDAAAQLNVFTDASIGGGSAAEGELYLTVHRRLLWDDNRGVSEPLNETESVSSYDRCSLLTQFIPELCGRHYGAPLIVRGRFTIQLLPVRNAMEKTRRELDRKYFAPLVTYPTSSVRVLSASLLATDLDDRLQLVTTHYISNSTLIVRLGHRYAVNESATLSTSVNVDLRSIFSTVVRVARIDEYSIMTTELVHLGVQFVAIRPMEIRTFIFTLQP